MYIYRAYCERVISPELMLLRVDLGFRVSITIKARLRGVVPPAPKTRAGQDARAFMEALVKPLPRVPNHWRQEWPLVIESFPDGDQGEWLCDIWPHGEHEQDLAEALIVAGHAERAKQ